MAFRRVKWNRRALLRLKEISDWYETHVGIKARDNFRTDTLTTIDILRNQPNIGILDKLTSTDKQKRYIFPSHPLIQIEYRFTDKELTVISLRSTRMKTNK